jgi:hypothetical protein
MSPETRAELFHRLETGEWVMLDGVTHIAGYTYADGNYKGPFVSFAGAFCGTVSRFIRARRLWEVSPTLLGLADQLSRIEKNGANVREGLLASGSRKKLLRMAAEFRLSRESSAVLKAIRAGTGDPTEIAKKARQPLHKVYQSLYILTVAGLVTKTK